MRVSNSLGIPVILSFLMMLVQYHSFGAVIKGGIFDSQTGEQLVGATIVLQPGGKHVLSALDRQVLPR